MYVCPVCKSRTVTVYGENSTAKCDQCGTYDALRKFEAAVIYTNPGERVPEAIFPPHHIIEAEKTMHHYFSAERGAKQWAFGHVQSRDQPALIGIEHIRNMALAFQMELITRPSHDALVAKVREAVNMAISLPHPTEETPSADQTLDFQARIIACQIDDFLFPVKL